ncbi:MAG: hypothetical protein GY765_43075, partial [bacterium]|nr:hypothetical protein [bacterium]
MNLFDQQNKQVKNKQVKDLQVGKRVDTYFKLTVLDKRLKKDGSAFL